MSSLFSIPSQLAPRYPATKDPPYKRFKLLEGFVIGRDD